MKILHVVYSFPPDPPGGTEVYVAELSRGLQDLGVETVVAAPGAVDASYEVSGVRVRRFAMTDGALPLEAIYGAGDDRAAASFARVLADEAPDIVHQHALTPACSIHLARLTKAKQLPLVFTYHTPAVSCARGTLLRWGREVCDGRLDAETCTRCVLDGHGVGPLLGRSLARLPNTGELVARLQPTGRVQTALRLPNLIRLQQRQVKSFFDLVDAFVILTPWVAALLEANGVSANRFVHSPHGVEGGVNAVGSPNSGVHGAQSLTFVHLGRLDPAKGTSLLVDAFRKIPDARISLDIFGITQDGSHQIRGGIEAACAEDSRIRLLPAIPHAAVAGTLARYDALLVPSRCMETGPLVVIEAFAAGVPVIGSDLGGIREKIRDGIDGVLVRPYASVDAWAAALASLEREPGRLSALRENVRRPRALADVATDMRNLYRSLVTDGCVPVPDIRLQHA